MKYEERTYRRVVRSRNLTPFRVVVQETDLWIFAREDFSELARDMVLECRGYIENYIASFPAFLTAMTPWRRLGPAPDVVRDMVSAGRRAGVGPMAAVAGAVAAFVGSRLRRNSPEVIVENGGDVFLCTRNPAVVGIMAGSSPLSMRIGLKIAGSGPVAVCTSSGTVGHSKSFGTADAVSVVSDDCSLADAAATAIGNRIHVPEDISRGIEFGRKIKGVKGIVIVKEDRIGLWGELEVVSIDGKNS